MCKKSNVFPKQIAKIRLILSVDLQHLVLSLHLYESCASPKFQVLNFSQNSFQTHAAMVSAFQELFHYEVLLFTALVLSLSLQLPYLLLLRLLTPPNSI